MPMLTSYSWAFAAIERLRNENQHAFMLKQQSELIMHARRRHTSYAMHKLFMSIYIHIQHAFSFNRTSSQHSILMLQLFVRRSVKHHHSIVFVCFRSVRTRDDVYMSTMAWHMSPAGPRMVMDEQIICLSTAPKSMQLVFRNKCLDTIRKWSPSITIYMQFGVGFCETCHGWNTSFQTTILVQIQTIFSQATQIEIDAMPWNWCYLTLNKRHFIRTHITRIQWNLGTWLYSRSTLAPQTL